ncbi:MAG TPA: GNAT family N-acetyltransferase [Pyrinomonadaceae bacterium]
MEDLIVISGRRDDVPRIMEIQDVCGLSRWTAAGYMAEVERLDSIVLVCQTSESIIIGFIVGRILPAVEGQVEREAEIYNIGVLPDYRNKGAGGKLLRRFIDLCRIKRVNRLWLEVRKSNSTAKTFYRGHGFVRHSTRAGFYSNPVEDADVMYLRL